MAFAWFQSKTQPIAVDVGTENLKLLQVEVKDSQITLAAAAQAEIPAEFQKPGAPRDGFLGEMLRKLIQEEGFKGRQVVTCLPANLMHVQHLRVPKMTPEELQKALPFEVQGKLPMDMGRAVLRHLIAGEVYQANEAKMEVILMAARRDGVERYLQLLSKAKLEVIGIHVEPVTMLDCFSHLFRRKTDETIGTLFIDLGASATRVVIAHGKQIAFARNLPIGGQHLTEQVAKALAITSPQARDLRVQITQQATGAPRMPAGIVALAGTNPNLGPSTAPPAPVLDDQAVEKAIAAQEDLLKHLVQEIHLCLQYFESVFPGRQIDRTIFVGGESRHVQICQQIAAQLDLPATLGDPLGRLQKEGRTQCKLDLRQPQPGWAVAVGLAIGASSRA